MLKSVVDWADAFFSGIKPSVWLAISFALIAIFLSILDPQRRLSIIRAIQYGAIYVAGLCAMAFVLGFFVSMFDWETGDMFRYIVYLHLDLPIILSMTAIAYLSMKVCRHRITEEPNE